jgi:hypothetical protein
MDQEPRRILLTPKLVDSLYVEAMVLADEARSYFDVQAEEDRALLEPGVRVHFRVRIAARDHPADAHHRLAADPARGGRGRDQRGRSARARAAAGRGAAERSRCSPAPFPSGARA